MVRSTKRILTSVLGSGEVSYDVFRTVLAQAAYILNSRPLTAVSNDLTDIEALSPLMCLHPGVIINIDPTLLKMNPGDQSTIKVTHERSVHLVRAFWKRWSEEYITSLRNRSKWLTNQPEMEVGRLVVLVDETRDRKQWKLGRVVTAPASQSDGKIRTVHVKTGNGRILARDVRKVVSLEY